MATPAANFQCPVGQCTKAYASVSSLRRHRRDKHSATYGVPCTTCSATMADVYTLKRHIARAHPVPATTAATTATPAPAPGPLPALTQPEIQGHEANDEYMALAGGVGGSGVIGNGQFENFPGHMAYNPNVFGAGQFVQGAGGWNSLAEMHWGGENGGGDPQHDLAAGLGDVGIGAGYLDRLRFDEVDGGRNFLAGIQAYDTGVSITADGGDEQRLGDGYFGGGGGFSMGSGWEGRDGGGALDPELAAGMGVGVAWERMENSLPGEWGHGQDGGVGSFSERIVQREANGGGDFYVAAGMGGEGDGSDFPGL